MRSGSTWQFNVVRSLSRVAGYSVYGAWVSDYDAKRHEALHVVKAHSPEQTASLSYDAVITCYRDLRTVAASLQRMHWLPDGAQTEHVETLLREYLSALEHWETRAVCVQRYEDIQRQPRMEIDRLAQALGFNLCCDGIREVLHSVEAIRPPAGGPTHRSADYDRSSLLHPGHIGSGETKLEDATRLRIESVFAGWLRDRQYV